MTRQPCGNAVSSQLKVVAGAVGDFFLSARIARGFCCFVRSTTSDVGFALFTRDVELARIRR